MLPHLTSSHEIRALRNTRAFNTVQLVDFHTNRTEAYYQRRLFDVANGRRAHQRRPQANSTATGEITQVGQLHGENCDFCVEKSSLTLKKYLAPQVWCSDKNILMDTARTFKKCVKA